MRIPDIRTTWLAIGLLASMSPATGCRSDIETLGSQCAADPTATACGVLADKPDADWLVELERRLPREQVTRVSSHVVAVQLNRRAAESRAGCAQGDALSCLALGVCLTADDLGCDKDLSEAARLFEQACEAGLPDGCASLGEAYRTGAGVPREPDRAATLYAKSCPAAGAGGCGHLARHVWQGQRGSSQEALDLAIRGCEVGRDPQSCTYAGCLVEKAGAVPPDGRTAADYYDDACDDVGAADIRWCGRDALRCGQGTFP